MNLNFEFQLWNPAVIPIIGPDAFGKVAGDVTTASEMFVCARSKLIVLQTRTPLTNHLLAGYIQEVLEFFRTEKLSQLIILTSSYSHEQHFVDKSPFEFTANEFVSEKNFPGFSESSMTSIPGCGYAKHLFDQATAGKIPAVILYKFSSEGNNFFDGIQLCSNVNNFLQVIATAAEIKTPVSWKHQFGCSVKPEIY